MSADVKVFAEELEDSARVQLDVLAGLPPFDSARVRIMPDAHAGKGCVIGFTADVTEAVIPNIVGVDIGCGILAVRLDAEPGEGLARTLDAAAHAAIPTGMIVHDCQTIEPARIEAFECSSAFKDKKHLLRSIGTLGGGNHFIECDVDPKGRPWLVVHSGSRNIGKQVAEIYQAEAVARVNGDAYTRRRDELIARLRAEGRSQEISGALAALAREGDGAAIPDDLCWLTGDARDSYLHDMGLCQQLACENRARIVELLLDAAGVVAAGEAVESVHNYIDLDHGVTRKGATAAYAGEPLIIPLNMAAGCVMGRGLGNDDWNCSAPHGAGRAMSRTAARQSIPLADYLASMEGIFTTTATRETLDESPQAYKDPEAIERAMEPAVAVDYVMRPVWNFKAADSKRDWKARRKARPEQADQR